MVYLRPRLRNEARSRVAPCIEGPQALGHIPFGRCRCFVVCRLYAARMLCEARMPMSTVLGLHGRLKPQEALPTWPQPSVYLSIGKGTCWMIGRLGISKAKLVSYSLSLSLSRSRSLSLLLLSGEAPPTEDSLSLSLSWGMRPGSLPLSQTTLSFAPSLTDIVEQR